MPSIPVPSTTVPNTSVQQSLKTDVDSNSDRLDVLEKGRTPDIANFLTQTVTNGDTTHAPSGDAVFDAIAAITNILVQTVTNGDTTHAPSGDAVFDHVAAAVAAVLTGSITNGDTTHAPNGDAVFDALALKAALASPAFTGNPTAPTPSPGDSDTSVATTAFVAAALTAAGITPTTWTAPTFTNSWANFGGTYQVVQYRKWGDEVELRGAMKSGTLNSAFTLPVAHRPPANLSFICPSNNGYDIANVEVRTNGNVFVLGYNAGGSNVFVDVSGIRFSITT